MRRALAHAGPHAAPTPAFPSRSNRAGPWPQAGARPPQPLHVVTAAAGPGCGTQQLCLNAGRPPACGAASTVAVAWEPAAGAGQQGQPAGSAAAAATTTAQQQPTELIWPPPPLQQRQQQQVQVQVQVQGELQQLAQEQAPLSEPSQPADDDPAREYQKGVVRSLRACSSWGQLQGIIEQHGAAMDAQSVTACCSAAAALAQAQQQLAQQQQSEQVQLVLEQQLLPLLRRRLHQLDTAGLVLACYTLAVLGLCDEQLLAGLEAALLPRSQQLTPVLASKLLWAFAVLEAAPQQLLVQRALDAAARQMGAANGQDCAMLLQALARLQQAPPGAWLETLYGRLQQLCHQLESQALCMVLHSLAALRRAAPLPAGLRQQLLHACERHLPALPPAGLNMATAALLRLQLQPGRRWLIAYTAAAHAAMGAAGARNVGLLLVPLAKWRWRPPAAWLSDYLAACEQQLPAMAVKSLAVLGHSLAVLRVQPPQAWAVQYMRAAQQARLADSPAGCSYLIQTLAAWQPALAAPQQAGGGAAGTAAAEPAAGGGDALDADGSGAAAQLLVALTAECVECFVAQGAGFSAEQLGGLCWGLAALGVTSGGSQLATQLRQVAVPVLKQQRVTATTLAHLLLALALSCPAAASGRLMRLVWGCFAALLPTLSPAHAAAALWAAGRLQQPPPARFAQQLCSHVAVIADEASLMHLAVLLLEAQHAGLPLRRGTARALLAQLLRKQAAAAAALAHAQLQHVPAAAAAPAGSRRMRRGSSCSCSSSNSSDSSGSISNESNSSSSSSSSQAGRLFGLANHRLKACILAAAAAAAWADVLPPRARTVALQSCEQLAALVEPAALPALMRHARCVAGGRSSSGDGGAELAVLLPAALASEIAQPQQEGASALAEGEHQHACADVE